ncbi:ComF family protein [Poritiphilus flavus]|uniref:ComF family protein n=1 Tax=Poritiphilus flavus TaxID=2697053 RepID=UPI00293B8AEF|nr:phosphoribosyltransferase family protein [Poritiphilus flavus]
MKVAKAASMLFFHTHGITKNLIHYLKYRNQKLIGIFLGDWFGEQLKNQGQLKGIDMVIPVPLHPKKLRKRGYNQVALFAERLAFHLNAEYEENLLLKTANTKTQTQKSRWYRWQGKQELYQLTDPEILKDKSVLLVDDVITTGGTLEACGKALHKAPGLKLFIATMAVVP